MAKKELKKCDCEDEKQMPEKQVNYFAIKGSDFKANMPLFCSMLRAQVNNGSRNYVAIVPDDSVIIMASKITKQVRCYIKEVADKVGYDKIVLITGVPGNLCGLPGYPKCQ